MEKYELTAELVAGSGFLNEGILILKLNKSFFCPFPRKVLTYGGVYCLTEFINRLFFVRKHKNNKKKKKKFSLGILE